MTENTISLYYIEGIDFVDTLYFSTKEKQTNYFNNNLIRTLETSYYPPYYTNKIRFSTDDLTLDTNVNYLSLYTNNRIYYYFINDITYINENLYELNIVMDTIQTYMFDIIFVNGCIERKFINRYDNSGINRNYIRENVSNTEFVSNGREYINEDTCWYIIKINKASQSKYITTIRFGDKDVFTSYQLIIYPATSDYYTIIGTQSITDGTTIASSDSFWESNTDTFEDFISKIDNKDVVQIYYIPFDIFKGEYIKKSVYKYYLDTSTGISWSRKYIYYQMTNETKFVHDDSYFGNNITRLNSYVNDNNLVSFKPISDNKAYILSSLELPFISNIKTGVPFSYEYVPALIDTSYINIKCGIASIEVIPELYYLKHFTVDFKASLSYEDGTIGLGAIINDEDYFFPRYSSLMSTENALDITLLENTDKNWFSNNKWGFMSKLAGAMITAFTGSISVGKGVSNVVDTITETTKQRPSKMTQRGKTTDRVRKIYTGSKTKKTEYTYKEVPKEPHPYSLSMIGNGIGDIIGNVANVADVMNYADTIKSDGTLQKLYNNGTALVYTEYLQRQDIEVCGWYYHLNGYLVNEFITNQMLNGKSIFDYVNTRHYYNVLKLANCNIHLNCIETREVIDNIEERLINGIRLWNTIEDKNNIVDIGNYSLDNVEVEYVG